MFTRLMAGACALAASTAVFADLLDPSFGFGGQATVAFDEAGGSRFDRGDAVFEVSQGRFLLVGQVDIADANPAVIGIGLARLQASGQIDLGFGGAGTGRRTKNAGLTSLEDVWLADGDKPLVVGGFGADSAMVRFLDTGVEDNAFAGDGGTVWDASGMGEADLVQAVAEIGARYYVAGRYDSAVGAPVDHDVFVGSVDKDSGALTVFVREELGGSSAAFDRVLDIELARNGSFGDSDTFAVLADNGSPDYAGTVMLIDADSTARLGTLRFDDVLNNSGGCDTQFTDPDSVALVRLTDRYMAVIGNLLEADFPRQTYVIVFDAIEGTFESATCGPVFAPGSIVSVEEGAAELDLSGFGDLHLAMSVNGRAGYWRWASRITNVLGYRPDPAFNDAQTLSVTFSAGVNNSPVGFATGVLADDEGRAVVIGARQWQLDQNNGIIDYDYALFRVHASETVFADDFEGF